MMHNIFQFNWHKKTLKKPKRGKKKTAKKQKQEAKNKSCIDLTSGNSI